MPPPPTPPSHPDDADPVLRASDIGQYMFCRRAWWLGSVQGYRPADDAALSAGARAHLAHGRRVAASRQWQRAGYALLLLGGLLGLATLCLMLGGGL
jgi:hypothetical protein